MMGAAVLDFTATSHPEESCITVSPPPSSHNHTGRSMHFGVVQSGAEAERIYALLSFSSPVKFI